MNSFRFRPLLVLGVALLLGVAVVWFLDIGRKLPGGGLAASPEVVPATDMLQPILPLVPFGNLSPSRVALGERLFHDARLSRDFSLSCASCHNLTQGGVDGRKVSVGIDGALGSINAPSVLNAAYSLAQFWDGRAATLEEQAAGPIHNPIEMGSNWEQVLSRLGQDSELREAFVKAYPDGLTAANVADAIATFERSLVTLGARFDRWLQGDSQALTALEVDGFRRFRELGCVSCHQGMLIGGNMFQKFGVMRDYFAGREIGTADLGRYNATGREEDRHVFKVPSLRNIALTAPYFHDASAETLEQAVVVMGRYQLGRELSKADVNALVAFLKTLTGQQPAMEAK